jgi:DNA invertase Pin-like site-specific DNA recombinase
VPWPGAGSSRTTGSAPRSRATAVSAWRPSSRRSTYLNGGAWSLADEVAEVESGKRNDRPELQRALHLCRIHGATLIIAKLDRLARNVHLVSNLMESGVEFVAVDFPQANRLTIHILAAVAEHEREAISQRTKAALAAARARGVTLGNPGNLTRQAQGRATGARAMATKAAARAADILPVIEHIRATGVTSVNGIARALNDQGIPTACGGRWQVVQVQRVLARAVRA